MDSNIFNCLICKEDKLFYSLGSCEHRGVCSYCCMKSRILYQDKKCPICNQKLDIVFIYDVSSQPSFSEGEANKEFFFPDDDVDENGIYFSVIDAKEEALKLRSFLCPIRSCQEGAFESQQILSMHLNKFHKRYYCEICLKECKTFLSEMKIYNYEILKAHADFGEFDDQGNLMIPPHPVCPFCTIRYYNDEYMYKHMTEVHFICQLCKDKKNIIFYQEVAHLLAHYKQWHYCCPYQECIDNIFVVFETEEKLNGHLITKHKCVDAKNKLVNFLFKNQEDLSKAPQNYNSSEKSPIVNEFNFSQYVETLKEKSIEYVKTNNAKQAESEHGHKGGRQGNRQNGRRAKHMDIFDLALENDSSNKPEANQYYEPTYTKIIDESIPNRNLNLKNTPTPTIDYSFIFGYFTKIIKEYIQNKIRKENPNEKEFILPKETIYQLIIVIHKLENHQKLLELTSLHTFGIDMNVQKAFKKVISAGELQNDWEKEKLFNLLDGIEIKKLLIIYKYISISSKKIEGLFYKLDLEQIDPDLYDDFVVRKNTKFSDSWGDETAAIEANSLGHQNKKSKKKKNNGGLVLEFHKPLGNEKTYQKSLGKNIVGLVSQNVTSHANKTVVQKQVPQVTFPSSSEVIIESEPKIESSEDQVFFQTQSKLTLLLDGKLHEEIQTKPVKKSDPWSNNFNKDKFNYDKDFPEL